MRILALVIPLLIIPKSEAGERKVDPVRVDAVVDLKNKNCPIGGRKVDGETYVDWSGIRVHFCCPGCDKKFQKHPAKALKKLGLEVVKGKKGRKIVDLANAKCPGMGGTAKAKAFGDHGGVRIRYCCPMCDKGVRKNPGAAFRRLGYAYIPAVVDLRNRNCPTSGKPVDGETFVDHDGIRVHFCCPGCEKGFLKNPSAAYARMGVDPDKVKSKTK